MRLTRSGQANCDVDPVCCNSMKIFWYCLHFCCCYGLILRQCEEGWVQVAETSRKVADVLTCAGVSSSQTVYWQFQPPNGSTIVHFGSCLPLPANCSSSLNTFTVSRPSTNVSQLTLSGDFSRMLAGATLYCYSGPTTANRVGCQVDIVYPPEEVTCHVQFNVITTFPWTVSGRCDIAKIYSSQNRYSCTWLESDGSSTQVIASKYVKWSTNQLSTNPILYSAICSLQGKPMPARRAIYAYRVEVSPGSISVNATFDGYSVDHTEPSDIETSSSMALWAGVGAAVGSVVSVVVLGIAVLVYKRRGQICQCQNGQQEAAQSDHGSETAHGKGNQIPKAQRPDQGKSNQPTRHTGGVLSSSPFEVPRENIPLVGRTDSDSAEQEQESGHGNRTPESPDPGKSKQATKQTEQAHSTEAVGGSKDSSSDNVKGQAHSTEAVGGSKDSSSDSVKEESSSNNEPSPTQNNKPQNEIPSHSDASSTDNGRNEKEVTVHPTQPPKTTQPPSPPTTSAPLTTSSRVTTATDVTANQMTAAPVMSQAEVTTTVHETIASPAPTTRIHVASAAVPTDGTNATGSVTMPSRHQ